MELASKNAATYDAHATDWATHTAHNVKYRFLEKPAMEALLPADLSGKRVLCIGVGSGEELDALLARYPRHITAIDISEKLLDLAKERYPEVECVCMDMMELGRSNAPQVCHSPLRGNDASEFNDDSFDIIYSSLAFHYANDWDALLTGIRRVLKPGGTLLFSTHHPNYWAKNPTGASHTNERGVKLTEHTATLPGGVEITYYNHPNTDSVEDALTHAGFRVQHANAPDVVSIPSQTLTPTDRKKYENLSKTNQKTPLFYVVGAQRV